MTRILVQRGSSSNRQAPTSGSSTSSALTPLPLSSAIIAVKDDEPENVICEVRVPLDKNPDGEGSSTADEKSQKITDVSKDGNFQGLKTASMVGQCFVPTVGKSEDEDAYNRSEFSLVKNQNSDLIKESGSGSTGTPSMVHESSYPPPPPVPPPKPSGSFGARRTSSAGFGRTCSWRRPLGWSMIPSRSSPTGSRPTSPQGLVDSEGYNSSDEQGTCFGPHYDDGERERQFELEIRRAKGLEVRRMVEDGNCLFRAIADQVYGDAEAYDLTRQMCIDYMERERDHFSQFITEGFTSYCKRKRRDKVYGNNVEIQALSEMYNRPIHIYCYSIDPINIFHGSYTTDTPPIRLSYHHGNHYNSLVDPRRLAIGAGLGFSSLQGVRLAKKQYLLLDFLN